MTRILIVEDQPDIRRLVRMTLEYAGYGDEILEAENADDGLEMARRLYPDVVLTDLMMPGEIDGLGLCQALKADEFTQCMAVVMISAKGRSVDREAGLQAGACAYLVKPFSPLELVQTLGHLGVSA
jgi:two-component system phosphate regulon response regulator PhoB